MKKLIVIVIGVFFVFSVSGQDSGAVLLKQEGPYIEFADKDHDFEDIYQGDQVKHTFNFKNSGTAPLILSNVLVTCGCTATDWPKQPILPGGEGSITVSFDSTGKIGRQNKVITILSNASNPQERVKIVANILPRKDINDY